MHSLLARIFLSFWLIIGVTIGVAALGGYWYAERARSAFEDFQQGDTLIAASAALEAAGRDGLSRWLESRPGTPAFAIYVLDRHGRDILDRPLPGIAQGLYARHRRHAPPANPWPAEPRNLRRARPLTQLVSPEGEVFTLIAVPPRSHAIFLGRAPVRALLLGLALVVSAAVSYLLARAITRPVRKLRDATVALADGNLDVRVGASLSRRRDEIGRLARDFDSMADRLQIAARRQTELTRNISHELRSPLARMRVALELARRRADNSAEIDRIDREVARLDRLIDQILSYSRLDSGDPVDVRDFDLGDLVGEVVEDVNYECRSGGIDTVTVSAEIAAGAVVAGDRAAMRSAVENVLRNAVRHSPAGTTVTVRLSRTGDGLAGIGITDGGPGVPEDELPKLFDAFYRTRQSSEQSGEPGTGLGLAIAARAVAQCGGRIEARNADPRGLRVSITLPVVDVQA